MCHLSGFSHYKSIKISYVYIQKVVLIFTFYNNVLFSHYFSKLTLLF